MKAIPLGQENTFDIACNRKISSLTVRVAMGKMFFKKIRVPQNRKNTETNKSAQYPITNYSLEILMGHIACIIIQ